MIRARRHIVAFLVSALVVASCDNGGSTDAARAPEFPSGLEWVNTGGEQLTLESLRGNVVALVFWSASCIECLQALPDFERLAGDFDHLQVVGVHVPRFPEEELQATVQQAVTGLEFDFPVVNDAGLEVSRRWAPKALPTVFLIDPDGLVAGSYTGDGGYEVIRTAIDAIASTGTARPEATPVSAPLDRTRRPPTVLSYPSDVAIDDARSLLYISDGGANRVVAADFENGDVVAVYGDGRAGLTDGIGPEASFSRPHGLALSADGRFLYVADTGNHAVRAIDLDAGAVTTIAGTGVLGASGISGGPARSTALRSPWDLAAGAESLYVTMAGSHQIWEIDLADGSSRPIAGTGNEGVADGVGEQAVLSWPAGLALDASLGLLYFVDRESGTVRRLDVETRAVETIVGPVGSLFESGDVEGVGEAVRLQFPSGLAISQGSLVVADTYNHELDWVSPTVRSSGLLAGGSSGWRDGDEPLFSQPGGVDVVGSSLYVADTGNHVVRVLDLETGVANTIVLKGIEAFQPTAADDGFEGSVIELEPAAIRAGSGTVVLDVTLPPGHKVNDEAPSSVNWTTTGDVVRLDAGEEVPLTGVSFPVSFPATFEPGDGTLVADLDLYWCAADAPSLCFIDQARLVLPVSVGDAGTSSAVLDYDIRFPDLP